MRHISWLLNVQRQLDTPVLFFGTDFDPNTPFSWTRSLAFALGDERNIVRYQGGGHTLVTRGTACVGQGQPAAHKCRKALV